MVFRPDSHRHSPFRPTFPPGRFVSHPLSFWCEDLVELREFLRGCKYVSDVEQFGEKDYWQPPDEFEKTKAGDCEDFALWAWRQLLHMNYPARFVVGSASRYGEGHAWVSFAKDGKIYLLEPLARGLGMTLPRLSVVRYQPRFSMSWNGKNLSFYTHEEKPFNASPSQIAVLVYEWIVYWLGFWLRAIPRVAAKTVRRVIACGT